MTEELAMLSINRLALLLQSRQVSPVEVTNSVLRRIEKYNEELHAYIQIYSTDALQSAQKAEHEMMHGGYRGKLHGVPTAIKDNIYFKNHLTTMGSKIHAHYIPDYDATVVTRLAKAGAVFVGKLNMDEYALGGKTDNPYFGTCRNPWDKSRSPGGSSGGAAVAMAAHLAIATLGTDTSGSIRIPASACGIVGLKPTFGRVSKRGCFPEAWSLDTVGPLTKTVHDAAALLEVIAGFDEQDPSSVNVPSQHYTKFLSEDIEGMVMGVNEAFYFKDVDSTVADLIWQLIRTLEKRGAKVAPVELPSLKFAEFALTITDICETSTVHHENLKRRPQDFAPEIRQLLELGEIPSAVDYLQAQQLRRRIEQDFTDAFRKADVLIGPTLPGIASKIGESSGDLSRLVGPANLVGLPSLTVPCGFNQGMPVGAQIIGPAFGEGKVLKMGYAVESTNPLGGKQPDLHR
ncbi:amidase [Alicyclobacillus sp. SO9]|uniref:amidase n=1 Tax=Alicyclobacillus sp. SO9 TaxID=2665646 RepID=UPI0018E82A92|nr:amidase [Alicyclobacillus sp. SO9]QQE79195.1 Asp-tRNA(Asn)/Glu-tRNA(Gln) amidotransferase GatCAB subunit A [Alicyclobacillus sp. SO9]